MGLSKGIASVERRIANRWFWYQRNTVSSPLTSAVGLSYRAVNRLRSRLYLWRQNGVLAVAHGQIARHYSTSGQGYRGLVELQDHEARHRYFTQPSRLEEVYRIFPDLLNFKNGQCFLDLGCGTGQNIRFLSKSFPESRIVGIDVNPHALGLIDSVENNPNLELCLGDLTQEATTDLAQELAPDHIVLSHVLEHVVGDSVLSTKCLRLEVLRNIAMAANHSVVIVDAKENLAPFRARFEQATRLSVQDDLTSYFDEIKGGRLVILPAGDSNTFVFCKD